MMTVSTSRAAGDVSTALHTSSELGRDILTTVSRYIAVTNPAVPVRDIRDDVEMCRLLCVFAEAVACQPDAVAHGAPLRFRFPFLKVECNCVWSVPLVYGFNLLRRVVNAITTSDGPATTSGAVPKWASSDTKEAVDAVLHIPLLRDVVGIGRYLVDRVIPAWVDFDSSQFKLSADSITCLTDWVRIYALWQQAGSYHDKSISDAVVTSAVKTVQCDVKKCQQSASLYMEVYRVLARQKTDDLKLTWGSLSYPTRSHKCRDDLTMNAKVLSKSLLKSSKNANADPVPWFVHARVRWLVQVGYLLNATGGTGKSLSILRAAVRNGACVPDMADREEKNRTIFNANVPIDADMLISTFVHDDCVDASKIMVKGNPPVDYRSPTYIEKLVNEILPLQ